MARKALVEVQEEKVVKKASPAGIKKLHNRLIELIPAYGTNKSKADELKKTVDDGNKEIKSICKQLAVNGEYGMNVDDWTMSYTTITKHNVNEERMLEIIKDYWSKKNGSMECPFIRTKEYIDQEALESAIFNGDIADKKVLLALKACDETKQEERLTVKKAKAKK